MKNRVMLVKYNRALPGSAKSVFEIIGKSHYCGQKKDAMFTLRHIVTESDMILAIFLDF